MNKTILLTLGASVLLALPAAGSGVNWGSPFFDNSNGFSMIDSHGNLLDDTFTFEMGTFVTGFTPTALNFDQWGANWKLLELANTANGKWNYNDSTFGPYVSGAFSFDTGGTVNGLAGSSTFLTGEQAYMWVRSGNEWALVTDSVPGTKPDDIWQLPNPADSFATPLSWDLGTASTAVFGTVNNGPIRLQTSVIPEPSTSLLVLMLGCLLQFTRHKRRLARA